MGGCDFGFYLGAVYGVGRLLGSLTLVYVVVICGLLCMTSNIVCYVFLWRGFLGVVFCLKILSKYLISCSWAAPMNVNGDVGAGLEMASIRSSAVVVAVSCLDITLILFCYR